MFDSVRVAPVVYSVKVERGRDMLSFGARETGGTPTAPPSLPPALKEQVQAGVTLLRGGGVVAFPTDTLYGLGADFSCLSAVQRVLSIKGRSEQMGLPLLLSGADDLSVVARDVPEAVWLLVRRFWPGALTLVVPRSAIVSDLVAGGRDSVAVRVPDHPVARALARGLGRPITGTSANRTGQPPAASAEEARRQLGASVDLVIEGGAAPLGLQSTIVDVTGPVLKLLRPGAISLFAIQSVYPGIVEQAHAVHGRTLSRPAKPPN